MARKVKRYLENSTLNEVKSGVIQYNVGIYSRLSVDNNDRKAESIENQIEVIKQYIEKNNSMQDKIMQLNIYDIYTDKGVSGTSFKRQGFDRLMDDVKNHIVDCIIVKDLSRFGRDYLETGNYIEKILPFLGVRFIAVTDSFDSMAKDAANGKLAMNIKNLVNDMYAKDISKRVTIARKMSAENGSFIGSFAPYGYLVENINGYRRLVIDNEPAKVVRFIFESFAEGKSAKEISNNLYEQGIHRISDYNTLKHVYKEAGETLHQWNPNVLSSLVKNQSYMGDLVQGKSKSELLSGKKGVRKALDEELIVIKDNHEPIISRELFDTVNIVVTAKTPVQNDERRKESDYENVFRNIVYCGKCSKKLKSAYYQSRVTGDRNYGYYCKRAYYVDARRCEKNYVKERQLETYVRNEVQKILLELNLQQKDLSILNEKAYQEVLNKYEIEIEQLDKQREMLIKQAGEVFAKLKEGEITRDEYLCFRNDKSEQEQFNEKRKTEIIKTIKHLQRQMKEENTFLRSLLKVSSEKKLSIQLVEALIDKILVYPEGVIDIHFKFNMEDDNNEQ